MGLQDKCLGEKFIETKANNFLYLITIALNTILTAVLFTLLLIYSFFPKILINVESLSFSYLITLIVLNIVSIVISILLSDKKIEIFSNGFIVNSCLKRRIILYEDIEKYKMIYPIFSYGFVLKIYFKNGKKMNLHESNFDDLKILQYKLVDRV